MAQNQYFEDNRSLPSNRKEHSFRFSGDIYTFITDTGVFSKSGVDYGTELLLKSEVRQDLHGRILDLGCGYGVVGIVLKRTFPDCTVTAGDVNPRALELTAENAVRNRCPVEIVESNGFEHISTMFDAVVTNPPIRVGKKVLYPLLEAAHDHLNPGGIFLAVIRRQQGAESAAAKLMEIYGNCEVIDRSKGYWILRCTRTN
ncbi:MAG: methyltransferase [Solobacterium sp.]|nr:methyltransferase [Solobacterium sp.]